MMLRSGSASGLKSVSGIMSGEPLPRYQNVSASKRALAKDQAFSSGAPAVPYTSMKRWLKADLKGPERVGDLSRELGAAVMDHVSLVRSSQRTAGSDER